MRSASYIWLTGWHLVHKSPQPVHGGNVLWKETHFHHCSLPPSWALALSGNLCILSSQRSDNTWNINGFPKSRREGGCLTMKRPCFLGNGERVGSRDIQSFFLAGSWKVKFSEWERRLKSRVDGHWDTLVTVRVLQVAVYPWQMRPAGESHMPGGVSGAVQMHTPQSVSEVVMLSFSPCCSA